MPKTVFQTAALSCLIVAGLASARAEPTDPSSDLTWEVTNPFRFYKHDKSFAVHEAAFKAVRGMAGVPSDIIQRIERCLNDPDPADGSAAACANLARSLPFDRRLGWASGMVEDTCYNRAERPRRHTATCQREGSQTPESFVTPAAHAVGVALASNHLAGVLNEACTWRFKPRAGGDWSRAVTQPCPQAFVIHDVPYRRDRAASGVEVEASLPGGRTLATSVVVEDLFVVALGDSFASGEGNPDRPVTFGSRGLDYRHQFMSRMPTDEPPPASRDTSFDSYVLPRRLMKDEEQGRLYNLGSQEFLDAFWERSAAWLSPECHRSQYAFPHRVALQLALEDRHRAITFVNLGCSGAEVVKGLFGKMDAREHYDPSRNRTSVVDGQFDQLTALICRSNARQTTGYDFKEFAPGTTRATDTRITMSWCPPAERRRDIDLVLLSVGGNDVGFGALAAYTFLEGTGSIARVAGLQDRELRYGPNVADAYLATLDSRLDKVRKALEDGFKVEPAKVIQASYEPVAYDETQRLCGRDPARAAVGMDVHSEFRYDATRVGEVSAFLDRLLERLQCISKPGAACHGRPPAGGGTGFTLVVEHQPAFMRRGICARDPGGNDALMQVPRIRLGQTDFSPYQPRSFRPYAHHQRLIRTPNDAYLTANEHKGGGTPLFDILQPAVAALYGGAFHPNAEAHALVADHVMPHVRRLFEPRDVVQSSRP